MFCIADCTFRLCFVWYYASALRTVLFNARIWCVLCFVLRTVLFKVRIWCVLCFVLRTVLFSVRIWCVLCFVCVLCFSVADCTFRGYLALGMVLCLGLGLGLVGGGGRGSPPQAKNRKKCAESGNRTRGVTCDGGLMLPPPPKYRGASNRSPGFQKRGGGGVSPPQAKKPFNLIKH